MTLYDRLISYEQNELQMEDTLELFQELLDTGIIFGLQGHYQRAASQLLQAGLITIPRGITE
jgi:hypothetical protein